MFLQKNPWYQSPARTSKREILILFGTIISLLHLVALLRYSPLLKTSIATYRDTPTPPETQTDVLPSIEDEEYEEYVSDYDLSVPGQLGDFPAIVWQTSGPKPLTKERRADIASWRDKNPFWSFNLLTNGQADQFVADNFAHRPDIVELFLHLPIAILKADLLRYLVLVAEGGVYADIDVKCEYAIDEWLPLGSQQAADTVNLIVGLEFDQAWDDDEVWRVDSQFTNWALMAKPGNKHLQHVIDSAVKDLYAVAEKNGVGIDGLQLSMLNDVVDVTGPKRMTLAILESLSDDLGFSVHDKHVADTKEPKLVGDVLIMPGNAFAAMQNGFPKDQGEALVTHHYAGSWKHEADAARRAKEVKEKKEEEARERAKKVEEENERVAKEELRAERQRVRVEMAEAKAKEEESDADGDEMLGLS